MQRFIGTALSLALATGVAACSDRNPSGPTDSIPYAPVGMVVSNALASSASASALGVTNSVAVAGSTVAYVSAVPGTFPKALSVAIRNVSNGGASQPAKVIDGGFDPVGIDAEAGDELSLALTMLSGGSAVVSVRVPPRRPPDIVRTSPSRGRTDVALNVQVEAVFSEPVDASSVTPSSFALLRDGTRVNGKVQLSADGLSATFSPDVSLDPLTNYSLTVSGDIRDRDGDSLGEAYVVTFTTSAATIAGTPPGVPEGPPMVRIMTGQIAFLDPWEKAIFIADSTGPIIRRVSQTSGAVDLTVSADGKTIAFSRNCNSSGPPCSQMYIMSVDRTDPLLLQTGDTREWPARPALSPDGKRLAFVQGQIGPKGFDSRHIYTINADGTGLTQLTHSGYNEWPSWSPDGTRIIFARSDDSVLPVDYGIFEMDPDGSNVRRLRSGFRDRWPTWSPDGSLIAFVGVDPDNYRLNLLVMSSDGSDAKVVKSGLNYDERPAWAPDGNSLTFVVSSASRMCEDIWDFGMVPCGQSTRRVGLDGVINPTWEIPSASQVVWQR